MVWQLNIFRKQGKNMPFMTRKCRSWQKKIDFRGIVFGWLKSMRYYMETIKIQHLFGRISIFFLVLIVVVFAEEYSINRLCLNINVLCLHIDMKNTSKSTLLLYSEDLDEGNERNMLMPRVFPKRLGRVNSVTSLQVFKNCSINIVLSI